MVAMCHAKRHTSLLYRTSSAERVLTPHEPRHRRCGCHAFAAGARGRCDPRPRQAPPPGRPGWTDLPILIASQPALPSPPPPPPPPPPRRPSPRPRPPGWQLGGRAARPASGRLLERSSCQPEIVEGTYAPPGRHPVAGVQAQQARRGGRHQQKARASRGSVAGGKVR